MDITQQPFFSLLRTRLLMLGQRQELIAENIANASTPGYRPRDLDMTGFDAMVSRQLGGGMAMSRTNAMHMTPGGTASARVVPREDGEVTQDGNGVVLEDETMAAAQTRMEFETGIALYQHGLRMIRLGARAPGR